MGPGKEYKVIRKLFSMETTAVLSVSSLLGLVTMFYTWHKDSKDTAKQIQKLETEVEQLKDQKSDIDGLKNEISHMKQTLARVDTNITHLMQAQQK